MAEKRIPQQAERAVEDALNLVAYSANKGIVVDDETLKTLTSASHKLTTNQWTPEFEVDFWKAFGRVSKQIRPATVDSVRAICIEPRRPGIWGYLVGLRGRSAANRSTNLYTFITFVILIILLFFQIYWVIGTTIEKKLSVLLDNEKVLTSDITRYREDMSDLELLFKLKEKESLNVQRIQRDYIYNFYSTPEWEQAKIQIEMEIKRLDTELESIRAQLERHFILMLAWTGPWEIFVTHIYYTSTDFEDELDSQIKLIDQDVNLMKAEIDRDKDASEAIEEKQNLLASYNNQLTGENAKQDPNLVLISQIQNDVFILTQELANPEKLRQEIIDQRNNALQLLSSNKDQLERELDRNRVKEDARQARLISGFILAFLDSYILPVLYGLLGASAYVLRSTVKDTESGIYSVDSRRNYFLRLALGTLAGLIVGWFVILLPGQTFLASISPFAISFLVGYNIEILFSWMDGFIMKYTKPDKGEGEFKNHDESGENSKMPNNGISEVQSDFETPENQEPD